ncbi:MAG: tRNA 4-thiouridine(8) synthase ThiI [Methanomassiliicoccus sp.]|jgi:thiamine biosynthesis protein ThiI|nr:tRNA 4-thiouridine(8) synthase ThiI [Methanomassiliicoccus sp.]
MVKVVCLLSGGIDSPVAAYSMGRSGADLVLLHMDNRPYCDDTDLGKVMDLSAQLERTLGRRVELYTAPHGPSQLQIYERCQRNLQCVLCKRTMLKVARNVARRIGADAVVTGESLGQVASQTLHNLVSEQAGLGFPVLRPLIGLDKLEIESIARRIGTYEISIRRSNPCNLVPYRPATITTPDLMRAQEERLDLESVARRAAEEAVPLRTASSFPA